MAKCRQTWIEETSNGFLQQKLLLNRSLGVLEKRPRPGCIITTCFVFRTLGRDTTQRRFRGMDLQGSSLRCAIFAQGTDLRPPKQKLPSPLKGSQGNNMTRTTQPFCPKGYVPVRSYCYPYLPLTVFGFVALKPEGMVLVFREGYDVRLKCNAEGQTKALTSFSRSRLVLSSACQAGKGSQRGAPRQGSGESCNRDTSSKANSKRPAVVFARLQNSGHSYGSWGQCMLSVSGTQHQINKHCKICQQQNETDCVVQIGSERSPFEQAFESLVSLLLRLVLVCKRCDP